MKQSNNSNNTALSTFESSFPNDFRAADVEQILRYVLAGKFCQLVCIPGGGKATLLKLLENNYNLRRFHLGEKEKSTRFIYLNLLELSNYQESQVYKFLLISLEDRKSVV